MRHEKRELAQLIKDRDDLLNSGDWGDFSKFKELRLKYFLIRRHIATLIAEQEWLPKEVFINKYAHRGDAFRLQDDIKTEFRYFCWKRLHLIRQARLPNVPKKSNKEAVIVETRILPHIEFVIRNNILKLGDTWSVTVVCGRENFMFMKRLCRKISQNISVQVLPVKHMSVDAYSALLGSESFWNMFSGEKILIFQEDSLVFNQCIDDYLEWDYIGAPWDPEIIHNWSVLIPKVLVGNGGFSLRTRSVMLDVIRRMPIKETSHALRNGSDSTLANAALFLGSELTLLPEDIYFSYAMQRLNIGKLPTERVAAKFSIEFIDDYDPVGGHTFWLAKKNWEQFITRKCIEPLLWGASSNSSLNKGFFINLDARTDRKESMSLLMERENIVPVRYRGTTPADADFKKKVEEYSWVPGSVTPTEQAVIMSFHGLSQMLLKEYPDQEYFLICEDDALLPDGFRRSVEYYMDLLDSRFDVLFLYGFNETEGRGPTKDGFYRVLQGPDSRWTGMVSFVCSRKFLRSFDIMVKNPINIALDHFIARHPKEELVMYGMEYPLVSHDISKFQSNIQHSIGENEGFIPVI